MRAIKVTLDPQQLQDPPKVAPIGAEHKIRVPIRLLHIPLGHWPRDLSDQYAVELLRAH